MRTNLRPVYLLLSLNMHKKYFIKIMTLVTMLRAQNTIRQGRLDKES
ncbi:hypothetical protein SAMN02745148_00089 [Modicisalibacter ilicicola DSM 19980]|uniref:Uncharacterized protein n=1 Tax=Modicisalibacter ilicicola DSM 19980 TaxID=1121942 RepID=A0A1M4SEP1_9GAMM|nr:hypothetical protein SAMN02745148_00089 [Halomonas ilicicola DSM 19980]